MPFEHRRRVKLIGSQPHKKRCWDESRDQHCSGMSPNRRAAKNLRPHLRMRNEPADSGDPTIANQVDDECEFACPLEKHPDNQHDRQREEGVHVE